MSEPSLADQVEAAGSFDEYCGNKDCPRGCGVLVEVVEKVRALEDKASALDLLEAWLDVHPERAFVVNKVEGKFRTSLYTEGPAGPAHRSGTQETLASAIRTVLGIAYANGDR